MIFDHNQLWRLHAAARHRQQRAHAQLLHVGALQHLDLHLVARGEHLRLFGKIGGRTDIARQISQIPRETHAMTQRDALLQAALGTGTLASGCIRQHQPLQRGRCLFLLAFHLLKAVRRFNRKRRSLTDAPVDRVVFCGQCRQVKLCVYRAGGHYAA